MDERPSEGKSAGKRPAGKRPADKRPGGKIRREEDLGPYYTCTEPIFEKQFHSISKLRSNNLENLFTYMQIDKKKRLDKLNQAKLNLF